MKNNLAVIMSVYKNDKLNYLKEALNSLYNQTYKNFDIFIQCDGKVSNEIEDFLDKEFKERKIYYLGKRDDNKGLAYSLNELLVIVNKLGYEYIARMDADDIALSNRFKDQIEFMDKNKDIDISGTYIEEFGDDINYSKIVKYPLEHSNMYSFFKKRVPLAHVSAFFRRTFFEKVGMYPDTNHISNEDTLMWMKGFKNNCNFANINIVGVKVRVNNAFFGRRSGYNKIYSDFKDRLKVIRNLNYGISSYFYAFAVLVINILPPSLKKIAYKYLR
jgi:glycosyltransferase involved in cell wall biosynthesis